MKKQSDENNHLILESFREVDENLKNSLYIINNLANPKKSIEYIELYLGTKIKDKSNVLEHLKKYVREKKDQKIQLFLAIIYFWRLSEKLNYFNSYRLNLANFNMTSNTKKIQRKRTRQTELEKVSKYCSRVLESDNHFIKNCANLLWEMFKAEMQQTFPKVHW